MTATQNINLESDKRAIKRKEFEAKLKEKEVLTAMAIEKVIY